MKRLICFFIGHKCDEWNPDSWFATCHRCQAHEYYHGNNDLPFYKQRWFFTIPTMLGRLKRELYWHLEKYSSRWLYKKCCDCNKAEILFGKPVGEHRRCLPF